MDTNFKYVVDRLNTEIKKDLAFFGTCGAFVGYFLVLHSRLKEQGIAQGDSWAEALFSDFISFNAFGLVFVGLIALGSISTIANSLGASWPRLEAAVNHLEVRLTQISSSIISFTLGLSVLAFLHSFMTITTGGTKLAILIVLFNALLFFGFFSAILVARRVKPFGTWWAATFILVMVLGALAWFIVMGTK